MVGGCFGEKGVSARGDVYTKYFRYTVKTEGYTKFVYTANLG